MVKCYFECLWGRDCPFPPTEMVPPQIGSKVILAGDKRVWIVKDVQHQFCGGGDWVRLELVNVILDLEEQPR